MSKLSLTDVASTVNGFSHSRPLLAQALANSSEFSLLCAEVLKYRLEKSKTVVQLAET